MQPQKGEESPIMAILKLLGLKYGDEKLTILIFIQSAREVRGPEGLLLADGAPTVGRGKTFWQVSRIFFTETAVTPERKVEKSLPRSEINRHAEG